MQTSPRNSIPLWPNGAPGALGTGKRDIPTLTPYFPEPTKATGAAIVVCPGGGYGMLADHEGQGYAEWLAKNGITAFVVNYRLGPDGYRHPAMLSDVTRALRLVRSVALDWNLDAQRIGVIGSSAGGHLAATLLTHFDAGQPGASDPIERESSRPDFGVLCYPVISMGPITHDGSRKNLLGDNPSAELVELLSNEKQVTSQTPPCFIWHTWEDIAVKAANSLVFAEALQKAGIPFEVHIYEKGGHGLGLGPVENYHRWTSDCIAWLRERGIAG
ncbi:MAG TPA: alpha/beta hydrolase [Chthoniobacterales bacterium]